MISYFFGMRGCLNSGPNCWQSILDLYQPLGPSFLGISRVTESGFRIRINFFTDPDPDPDPVDPDGGQYGSGYGSGSGSGSNTDPGL